MKPALHQFAPGTDNSTSCPVVGYGIVHADPDQIAALRRNPVPFPGTPLPATMLKHADEQTAAAVAAVFQAIQDFNLGDTNFSRWGVVATPCFLGRASMVHALNRFRVEGAWGISPHLIPHHSIHAVSGTISQILKIHGPNFGIGGGPGGVAEALMVAATLLADPELPGLWLVFCEYDPELLPADPGVPQTNGHHTPIPLVHSLALALAPPASASTGMTIHVGLQGGQNPDGNSSDGALGPTLENCYSLAEAFSQNNLTAGKWRLGDIGWLEITRGDLVVETLR